MTVNAENVVDGAGHDRSFLVFNLVMDGVEPYDRIDVFKLQLRLDWVSCHTLSVMWLMVSAEMELP